MVNNINHHVMIGLISAGLIAICIPISFFTIGKYLENKAIMHEVNRYAKYLCSKIPFKINLTNINNIFQEENVISNKNITVITFTVSILFGLILVFIANLWCLLSSRQFVFVWIRSSINIVLFVLIELLVTIILLSNYSILDTQKINNTILNIITQEQV